MSKYDELQDFLLSNKFSWLITGGAGFIGSNLVEALLKLNQKVVVLDNLSTGKSYNIEKALGDANYSKSLKEFKFIEGDISSLETCKKAIKNIDIVLHQAALGSVPRSIKNPIDTNNSNVNGFLNILHSSKEAKVKKFIYASSSSVYGSNENLPKIEHEIGEPLSPYALSKLISEKYAQIFSDTYNFNSIGLRYFNVFGKRQNIDGPYAAVIPRWISAILKSENIEIYGDGSTGRDFCFIDNVIQANLLAAFSNDVNEIFNVALNQFTNLNDLFKLIISRIEKVKNHKIDISPVYKDFREGDIKSSIADIKKISSILGYTPTHEIKEGIDLTVDWFVSDL
ncbi:SDR family oxidoreductase [SAR86 cluster bacterium]|nr:SDR family oxidoreductase [SAR86 cluster bacterium]